MLYKIPLYFISLQLYASNVCIIKQKIHEETYPRNVKSKNSIDLIKCYPIEGSQLGRWKEIPKYNRFSIPIKFPSLSPLNPFDSIKNKLNNEVNIESPLISREQCCFHETGINFSGMITRCNLQKFSLTRELTVSSLSRLMTKIHARSKDT